MTTLAIQDIKNYHSSCTKAILIKAIDAIKFSFKMYSIWHASPYLLYSKKRKDVIKNPIQCLKSYIRKVLGSMSFLSIFVITFRAIACLYINLEKIDISYILLVSIIGTSGVLFEEPFRGEEYAIFTYSKISEGFWKLFKKFGFVKDIKFSMNFILALSLAVLLYSKKYYNKEMPGNYKNAIEKLFGDDDE